MIAPRFWSRGAAALALLSMTRTPWGETGMMARFLDTLREFAGADREDASRIGGLLATPFAGGALYEQRMLVWLTLALLPQSAIDCRVPLRYFERGAPDTLAFRQARVDCLRRILNRPRATTMQDRQDFRHIAVAASEALLAARGGSIDDPFAADVSFCLRAHPDAPHAKVTGES